MSNKNKTFISAFFNALSTAIMFLSIALLAFAIYTSYQYKDNPKDAYLFGYKPVLVLTGSMEPTLKVNGLAIVQKTSYNNVETNDIIMYELDDKLITHRVIEKTDEGIVTKGDNNNTADSYIVTKKDVKAKVVSVLNFTAKPLGDIFPDGIKGARNNRAMAKWISFPIFIIAVIEITKHALRKIDAHYNNKEGVGNIEERK